MAEVSRETLRGLVEKSHLSLALTESQWERLEAYGKLLLRHNEQVNLISRRSAGELVERHLLHSLALAVHRFPARSSVVDWGTGGGLPGIPLAIVFPDVQVHLVDSIAKKVRAVREMVEELGLENVTVWNVRAEHWTGQAHYAVSRATAPLQKLWKWYHKVRKPLPVSLTETDWNPGLIALKGGDLSEEIRKLKRKYPQTYVQLIPLEPLLQRPYFVEKYLVHVTA